MPLGFVSKGQERKCTGVVSEPILTQSWNKPKLRPTLIDGINYVPLQNTLSQYKVFWQNAAYGQGNQGSLEQDLEMIIGNTMRSEFYEPQLSCIQLIPALVALGWGASFLVSFQLTYCLRCFVILLLLMMWRKREKR